MADQAIVEFIAARLREGSITWPGDQHNQPFGLNLPMFAPLPAEMAEHFAAEAGLPHGDVARIGAEAFVHLINASSGSEIVDKTELQRLRTAAAANEHLASGERDIHCRRCGKKLLTARFSQYDTDKLKVDGPGLIAAMQAMSAECAGGH